MPPSRKLSAALLTAALGMTMNATAAPSAKLPPDNPVIEKAQTEMAPKLSAHSDAIFLDPQLFARVKKLYEQRQSLKLDPESLRLLERYHTKFVRAGANLTEAQKADLRALNEK